MPIPSISLRAAESDPALFAAQLGAAFERSGFAILSEHDLPLGVTDGALERAKAFFALPERTKLKYVVAGGAGQRGYTPFGVEAAKGSNVHDLKEFWHVGRDLPPGHPHHPFMAQNVWPEEIPGFQDQVYALFEALASAGDRVLQGIARYLNLPERWFESTTRDGASVLRLLHYPPVSPDSSGVRASAHEDINVITLLLGAEEAGLELLDRDGSWTPLSPPAGAIVCNVGDMLQRLSNHVLPSTTHRVVNPAPDRRGFSRYSTPFFLHFSPEFLIRTLPGCFGSQRPDRYPEAITSNAYLRQRLREIKLER